MCCVVSFLIGAMVGGGIALLAAPNRKKDKGATEEDGKGHEREG